MPRLVTFGCSFVYGHGLPDCFTKEKKVGSNPSKFAWPQLLADKLGHECVNLSHPGSGNFEIFMRMLHTEFAADDLVITAWTFFPRYDLYGMIDFEGQGYNNTLKYLNMKVNPIEAIVGEHLKNNEKYLEQNYWDNWLIMQHAELFLNDKNLKNISYHGLRPQGQAIRPKLLNFKNFIDIGLILEDRALDDMHPGLESHRLQAELIYSKLVEHELR